MLETIKKPPMRSFSILTFVSVLAACTTNFDSSSAKSDAQDLCPNLEIQKLLEPYDSSAAQLISVADQHGNNETLITLRCVLSMSHGSTLLAYELPKTAGCTPEAEKAELCSSAWTRTPYDGRTSEAAARFLTEIPSNKNTQILFFDPDLTSRGVMEQNEHIALREELSANIILSEFKRGKFQNLVVFTGSLRASRDPYSIVSDDPIPTLMMRLEKKLNRSGLAIITANIQKSEIWQCHEKCGVQIAWPTHDYYKEQVQNGIYDLVVPVNRFSISRPLATSVGSKADKNE